MNLEKTPDEEKLRVCRLYFIDRGGSFAGFSSFRRGYMTATTKLQHSWLMAQERSFVAQYELSDEKLEASVDGVVANSSLLAYNVCSYSVDVPAQFQGYHGFFAREEDKKQLQQQQQHVYCQDASTSSTAVQSATSRDPPRGVGDQGGTPSTAVTYPATVEVGSSVEKTIDSLRLSTSTEGSSNLSLEAMAQNIATLQTFISNIQKSLENSRKKNGKSLSYCEVREEDLADDDVDGNGGYEPSLTPTLKTEGSRSSAKRSKWSKTTFCETSSTIGVATYKPTPIAELEKRQASRNKLVKDDYVPSTSLSSLTSSIAKVPETTKSPSSSPDCRAKKFHGNVKLLACDILHKSNGTYNIADEVLSHVDEERAAAAGSSSSATTSGPSTGTSNGDEEEVVKNGSLDVVDGTTNKQILVKSKKKVSGSSSLPMDDRHGSLGGKKSMAVASVVEKPHKKHKRAFADGSFDHRHHHDRHEHRGGHSSDRLAMARKKASHDSQEKQPSAKDDHRKLALVKEGTGTGSRNSTNPEKKCMLDISNVTKITSSDLFGEESDEESHPALNVSFLSSSSSSRGFQETKGNRTCSAANDEGFGSQSGIEVASTSTGETKSDDVIPQCEEISFKKKRISNVSEKDVVSLRNASGLMPRRKLLSVHDQLNQRLIDLKNEQKRLIADGLALQSLNQNSVKIAVADASAVRTVEKGERRIAHTPKLAALQRPLIVPNVGSKVATSVRQQYLNLIVDECVNLYGVCQTAYDMALEEEKLTHSKSSSRAAYVNQAVNTIKRLRDTVALSAESRPSTSSAASASSTPAGRSTQVVPPRPVVSHSAVIGGKKALINSFTVRRSRAVNQQTSLKDTEFYKFLLDYVLNEAQLKANGFPLADPMKSGRAMYCKPEVAGRFVDSDSLRRNCCRCGRLFELTADWQYLSRDTECVFHYGRLWEKREGGVIEKRYNCCQGDTHSTGCAVAKYHVTDSSPMSFLEGYVQPTGTAEARKLIYSLDCEMVYTTLGYELARITVIDTDLKQVYDEIVRPEGSLLDCNSRYSGLTAEQILKATKLLSDVQRDLLQMFSADTILIGHSLECDLRALKIIHRLIVDTSIVFPHRLGPPLKRALKTLMGEYLKKIIQVDVGGHDSKEDASACMELMKWKVAEESKKLHRSGL